MTGEDLRLPPETVRTVLALYERTASRAARPRISAARGTQSGRPPNRTGRDWMLCIAKKTFEVAAEANIALIVINC